MPSSGPKENLLKTASSMKWARFGLDRRSGVLVPLFSVYSKKSSGIGDLGDLISIVDWAVQTGNSIIQLLPMNETGFLFCPYDSVSSFALEPIYISLEEIAQAKDETIIIKLGKLKKSFPVGMPYVDYAVKKEKISILWEIFLLGAEDASFDFKQFQEENKYWLLDFAFFNALKNHHNGRPWYEWDLIYRDRDKKALDDFKKYHEKEIIFQMWVQWQLYKQLKRAKDYSEKMKVLLKGDLPILVSRDSSDVWAHPEFFNLEFAAGAPPDMYCAKGQRWGMPTYKWDQIAADGYRYLKEKIKYAQNFYHFLRVDHVVGLFRIWSIPYNDPIENQGLNGFFDPRDKFAWKEHGQSILSVMLESSNMLLCAEDLGTIPQVCTDTLKELGIPGNDVQRWIKDWKVKYDFLEPEEYRELSVAMLSTHDTTNWPAWWENEAGTVDAALFQRKCADGRRIDFDAVKEKLFDPFLSRHGRLRWQNSVDSEDKLVSILGRKKEELADFLDLYLNSYKEKEKLWKHLGLAGQMREKCDAEITRQALKISLDSSAIFCINTLIDWLYIADIFKDDPYQNRTNTPGTISEKNWSLTILLSLEELLEHKANKEIRQMISASERI